MTKRFEDEGWEHETCELVPINPEFSPISITPDNAAAVRIRGEILGVF